jgi:8-oxo-dGTP pyrophosphatase MutT (NUDIX family)
MMELDKTSAEIALQEAWEEAGLVGTLSAQPVGTYCYEKFDLTCHVTVYRMDVTELQDNYPERALRRREWLQPDDAIARIEEPGLRDLLRQAMSVELDVAD